MTADIKSVSFTFTDSDVVEKPERLFYKTGSQSVAQAGLELVAIFLPWPPQCGITGMRYHAPKQTKKALRAC